jgi:anti-sigma B factor antagonist
MFGFHWSPPAAAYLSRQHLEVYNPEGQAMTISEEIRGDVAVLVLRGNLLSGPDVTPFHDHIKELLSRDMKKVVVDFSKVKWCGSAMLGTLVASLSTLRDAGGDLRPAQIMKKVRSVFFTTQLSAVFKTFDTVDEAVSSYA